MAFRRRFLLGAASTFGAIGIVRAPVRPAQFEFKVGTALAPDHPTVSNVKPMLDLIEKESGGRVAGALFPNNQLGNESAMFTQLRVGALQCMIISPGFLSSVIPVAEISSLGFTFKDSDDALRVMDGPVGAYVRNEVTSKGLYAFRGAMDGGMYLLGSVNKPIRTPDDLAGFKVRVVGKIAVDLFKDLGANPVAMNLADVYTGLQTHLIDGEATTAASMETSKFWEVQKYMSLTHHAWSAEWMIVNSDTWKSFPPDLQAIFERNHAKYVAASRAQMKTDDTAMIAKAKGHGLAVNDVDQAPFRARLKSYYAQWATTFGPTVWGLLETALGRKIA